LPPLHSGLAERSSSSQKEGQSRAGGEIEETGRKSVKGR